MLLGPLAEGKDGNRNRSVSLSVLSSVQGNSTWIVLLSAFCGQIEDRYLFITVKINND